MSLMGGAAATVPETAGGNGQKPRGQAEPANSQWLRAALPAFPLVLLVLRLWVLSRQDLQTMLLLLQYVNPLGLITALIITLIWVLPAAVLTVRALSALLLVSDPTSGSRLARESNRMPGWVVALAVLLAALTWQLRFLPALLMSVLMIVGLDAQLRYSRNPTIRRFISVALPVGLGILCYFWLLPGIVRAFTAGEVVNGLLLLVPPGIAVLLTGPVPHWAARAVTRGTVIGAAVLGPVLVGVIFSRAPVLPTVAMELSDPQICRVLDRAAPEQSNCVLLGEIITVDDRMVTMLRHDGTVVFVSNDARESQALCATGEEVPTSRVDVRGWQIEDRVLDWVIPPAAHSAPDPRCQGRPLPQDAGERQGSEEPGGPAPAETGGN